MDYQLDKGHCEFLRNQTKQRFDQVRTTWVDCGKWALPHRTKWLLSQTPGERNNQHIVDATHVLALRSYVAGFLEGNTSASRPWYRHGVADLEKNANPDNRKWLSALTNQTLKVLGSGNFYDAAGGFYYDFGVFNTGAHYIEERANRSLFFHNLTPGSYFVLNDAYGEAIVMVREFCLNVKALVDQYGKKKDGKWDWSNFSSRVKKMYEDGNYSQQVDVVHIMKPNPAYEASGRQGGSNRQWMSITYELGGQSGPYYQDGQEGFGSATPDTLDKDNYLSVKFSKRKPFIVGKSQTSGNFEYGEKGPTLDALGVIKSLNKKAISKDKALDQMLQPPLQGPASLKKSYVTSAPNSYVPLDAQSLAQKGLRTIFEVNPAVGALVQDVSDLRKMVEQFYYADYLLYLSQNPKTRTATETDAIVSEQRLVIGPNLQSLNWTYNVPIIEFVTDWVLDEDPYLPEMPEDLAGQFLRPEMISVFAQAQKAADLPAIERYIAMISNVGQVNPKIWDKANLDKLADLYEDRLYLPAGLNNPTEKAEALREQAMMRAQQQQQMEQVALMAGAAKDMGMNAKPKGE